MEYAPDLLLIFGYAFVSFLIALFLTKPFLIFLHRYKIGKNIRADAVDGKPASLFRALHLKKSGTPTMGGILICGVTFLMIAFSYLPYTFGWVNHTLLDRAETYLPLFTLGVTGILGAVDDYLNVRGLGKNKGISAKPKFWWLLIFAALGAWWFFAKLGWNTIHIPRLGDFYLGWWYIPLFILVIISSAHAVNITDGLDGLASGLLTIAFGSFAIIAYAKGLLLLTTFCSVVVGANLAFLWFNIAPAKFYMGDTGALSLGATLGVLAMLTNSVIVLPFIGFVFVIETISVIIQLLSKKFLGRKVFTIAPLHHHLEQIGWNESQIVMRLWIIGGIFAGIGVIIGLIGMGKV